MQNFKVHELDRLFSDGHSMLELFLCFSVSHNEVDENNIMEQQSKENQGEPKCYKWNEQKSKFIQ